MNSASTGSQRLIVVGWVRCALAAVPSAVDINDRLDGSAWLEDSESAKVEVALLQRFQSPFTKIALLRIAAAPSPQTDEGQALLKRVTEAIERIPEVQGVISYLDRQETLFIGADGSPIIIVGLHAPKGAEETLMAKLAGITGALPAKLSEQDPHRSFGWTGEAVVNADMRPVTAHETRGAELP